MIRIPYSPSATSRHGLLLDAVKKRFKYSRDKMETRYKKFKELDELVLAYVPESDITKRKKESLKSGGAPDYYTIEIPYTYAELLTAHTYISATWLGRYPVFQYVGRHGEGMHNSLAVEACIDYQMKVGHNIPQLYVWIYDAWKYGLGVIGCYWDEEYNYRTVEEEIQRTINGYPVGSYTQTREEELLAYMGNKLFNVRPFDFFPDPRVPINKLQEGEFVGWESNVGWNKIYEKVNQGVYLKSSVEQLRKNAWAKMQREQGSPQMEMPADDALEYDPFSLQTMSNPLIKEMIIELIPSLWGLGRSDRPQKWVFEVGNDEVLLSVRPYGAPHNMYPFLAIEPDFEAYTLLKRSPLETTQPMQDVITWLFNSHFYNVRKTLNNQLVVDPSKVEMNDLTDPLPGGVIRAKPGLYGDNLKMNELVHQLQVVDLTRNHIGDARGVIDMAQRISGINDSLMGLVQGSGRKTATEIRQGNTFGISRLKTITEFMDASGFSLLAQMLVQNTQEYWDASMKLRVAGDITASPSWVMADPESIAGFYDFVPVDGTMPLDKFALLNLWKELLINGSKVPAIAQGFDIAGMFSYMARMSGIRNIDKFKISMVPDQMFQDRLAGGNVVPLGGQNVGGGGGASERAGGGGESGEEMAPPPAVSGVGRLA